MNHQGVKFLFYMVLACGLERLGSAQASKCKGFEELDTNPPGINPKYPSSLSTELLALASMVWVPLLLSEPLDLPLSKNLSPCSVIFHFSVFSTECDIVPGA